jgi:hypothetical protein
VPLGHFVELSPQPAIAAAAIIASFIALIDSSLAPRSIQAQPHP